MRGLYEEEVSTWAVFSRGDLSRACERVEGWLGDCPCCPKGFASDQKWLTFFSSAERPSQAAGTW